ncbi:translational GTPase TypA [Rickettsiales bacterium LUAb2]
MKIRNIAIIAHVDHGKTTLVDALLKQTNAFKERAEVQERAMDSNDIERERGITILSKCTAISWQDYKINVVDTPGHADFGGEVERILGMVEGVVLVVDAREGAMPQTRFVTSKALELGLKPIVVINKMDREDKRPSEVINEIFELFINLGATDEQADFPVLYAAGLKGLVGKTEELSDNIFPLLETIVEHVPAPTVNPDEKFGMVVSMLESDSYMGRVLTGKVVSGKISVQDNLKALNINGQLIETTKVSKIMTFKGLAKEEVKEATAGDIVAIAGFEKATVSDTLCDMAIDTPLPARPIDPPVLAMTFAVNDSPLAGKDGKKLTSRLIRDRLFKEQEGNVSIKIEETANADTFLVKGRGELQLAILIENLRREGFELSIGRPSVIIKIEDGVKKEPMELAVVEVDEEFAGVVIEAMQKRKGRIDDMFTGKDGKQKITFIVPTRGLIGYYGKFLTDTKGTGTMSRSFNNYEEYKGDLETRYKGVLISIADGQAVAYALFNLEDRGIMFVDAGDLVYTGMIIGENSKDNDLEVNPLKGKQLTNMRASGKDESVSLTPPRKITLESAISYIADDELIEVTPNFIRLRKKMLDSNARKKESRSK